MQRFCPKCRNYFAGQMLCPNCFVQLQASTEGPTSDASSYSDRLQDYFPQLQPPFWMRFLIGLILAQGLYYGLRELVLSYLYAVDTSPDWWGTDGGWIAARSLQLTALFVGALVAGAGHSRAVFLGLVLGICNSVVVLVAEYRLGSLPEGAVLYGQPVANLVAGVAGGLLGRLLWRPVHAFPALPGMSVAPYTPFEVLVRHDPLRWAHIVLGAALALVGTVGAEKLRMFLSHAGTTTGGTLIQVQFVDWQLATLALLAGGAYAGANTRSGLRHGMIAGALAAVGLIVAQFSLQVAFFPAHEFWLGQLELLPSGGQVQIAGIVFCSVTAWLTATVGGWLGAELMPPTVQRRMLRFGD
jgi:hypothetical protein